MFNNLTNFSYTRSAKEAFGFYLVYLFLFILLGFVIEAIVGMIYETIWEYDRVEFLIQSVVNIVSALVIAFISICLLRAKKLGKDFKYIFLAISAVFSALFLGFLFGLVIPAFITRKRIFENVPPLKGVPETPFVLSKEVLNKVAQEMVEKNRQVDEHIIAILPYGTIEPSTWRRLLFGALIGILDTRYVIIALTNKRLLIGEHSLLTLTLTSVEEYPSSHNILLKYKQGLINNVFLFSGSDSKKIKVLTPKYGPLKGEPEKFIQYFQDLKR